MVWDRLGLEGDLKPEQCFYPKCKEFLEIVPPTHSKSLEPNEVPVQSLSNVIVWRALCQISGPEHVLY